MTATVCIVGAGGAGGAALCALYAERGARVLAMARDRGRLREEIGDGAPTIVEMDVTDATSVQHVLGMHPEIETLVYNAGRLDLASLAETTPETFEASWRTNTYGAFVCARTVSPAMVARGHGALVFVGATGSVRGSPRTHAFASAKHALRGLASALAKELAPKGVHVAHVVIDGKVWGGRTRERFPSVDEVDCIAPRALADAIAMLVDQPPSAWTFEMDLRPRGERWS